MGDIRGCHNQLKPKHMIDVNIREHKCCFCENGRIVAHRNGRYVKVYQDSCIGALYIKWSQSSYSLAVHEWVD